MAHSQVLPRLAIWVQDRSIDREDTSSGRSAPRASGLQAGPPKQAQQQQRQRQQPQGRREQPQGRQDASSAADAVTSTAALPRGPGVLRDVDDGASGGVQVWSVASLSPEFTPAAAFIGQANRMLAAQCSSNPFSRRFWAAVLQGLSWYRARLQQDADGDVAEQFLSEATSQLTAGGKPVGQPEHSLEVRPGRFDYCFVETWSSPGRRQRASHAAYLMSNDAIQRVHKLAECKLVVI